MWTEWLQHPITKEWWDFMSNLKEDLKESWASQLYVGISQEETIQRNSFALGQVDLLTRLLQADIENMKELNYEDE